MDVEKLIKDVEIQRVYEEKPGSWNAMLWHRLEEFHCAGTGNTAEEAILNATRCLVDILCGRGLFVGDRPTGPKLTTEEWEELQIACCHYENETNFDASAKAWRALDALRIQAGMPPAPREWPATDTREAYPIYDKHIKPLQR